MADPRGLHRIGLGLRDRVAIIFGLLTLGLSVLLAVMSWLLVSQYLIGQRESAAWVEAADNARLVSVALHHDGGDVPAVLDGLAMTQGEVSLLVYRGQWYSTGLSLGPSQLPEALRSMVQSGTAARQRIEINGQVYLAVGVPLGATGTGYFELFTLADLNRTFRVLTATLVVAAVATSLIGLWVGWLASRRALRPLRQVTRAAERFVDGDLDVRLDEHDPDLTGLSRSFNQAADALQRRVIADARFAGDVSHELRTPLTTMLNSMELLLRHVDELPPAVREPVDLLATDLNRFRRMVVDLIEISRDDAGDRQPLEPVRIDDLVRQAADAAAGRAVTQVATGADGTVVLADKRRLERVVTNLVENAEVYGDGCLAVTVSCADRTPDGSWVTIDVDDGGPGVPPSQRERVFARFARETQREGPGVGLGLAIVARHVHWHGGEVTVTDRPGGGARFSVALPVERRSARTSGGQPVAPRTGATP